MAVDRGNKTMREMILGSSSGYRAFKVLTRGDHTMRAMTDQYIQPQSGERILDVGCGYGDLSRCLRDVSYVGVDSNEDYIEFAQRDPVRGAVFVVGDVTELSEERYGRFDCAVLIGVLHHLSDNDATRTLKAITEILDPAGRLVAAEPVWEPSQRTTARVLAALDRGRYVREQERYNELVSRWFAKTVSEVRHDLFWFPYTHCMISATLTN
jgi:2-polyprenyl-3-methyl-5-hydroxy-6-metoxy-1,4-benzoquinol methylase